MNPISWIAERVVTAISQIIGGAVVTHAETEALRHHVNAIGNLEAEAKKHEEAGNPLLAQILRDNSKRLASRTDFTSLDFTPPKIEEPSSSPAPVKNISHEHPGKKKRGRPRKNKSPDSQPASPSGNVAQQ